MILLKLRLCCNSCFPENFAKMFHNSYFIEQPWTADSELITDIKPDHILGAYFSVFSFNLEYVNVCLGYKNVIISGGNSKFKVNMNIQDYKMRVLKAAFHKFYLVHSWILCPKLEHLLKMCQTLDQFFWSISCTSKMLLILSWRRSLSYRNQSIDWLCKSIDWFLYDRNLWHERVNASKKHY